MNELRDEMAMCAHMRVNHKRVLLDGKESGRISDSWVCGDCGTLFIPEAANREQKAEIERLNKDLAECYRLSGADPDGNEDWRLAPEAVKEVTRLRQEYDDYETEILSLRPSVGEKWIDVKQELPHQHCFVLVTWGIREGVVAEAYCAAQDDKRQWILARNRDIDISSRITHWQPLPAPPCRRGEVDDI